MAQARAGSSPGYRPVRNDIVYEGALCRACACEEKCAVPVRPLSICASFPPKVHDGTPDPALPTCFLTCRYNELRVDAEGHLNAPA
jgi:hypothetical protein